MTTSPHGHPVEGTDLRALLTVIQDQARQTVDTVADAHLDAVNTYVDAWRRFGADIARAWPQLEPILIAQRHRRSAMHASYRRRTRNRAGRCR